MPDRNGEVELPAQEPFSIVLTVNGASDKLGEPSIAGLGQFVLQGTSSTSRYLVQNGVMSAERSFIFTVRAPKPGLFTVGPAQISISGKIAHSDRVKVKVVTTSASSDKGPAFLEVAADKKSVLVGQPVTVVIKFYMRDGVQVSQPLMLDFARHGWTVKSSTPQPPYTKTIRAQVYTVHEHIVVLQSATAGQKTIPALTVDCVIPSQTQHLFDMFGFAGRHGEAYQAHSDPITIIVTELPSYKGTVHGMGNLTELSASLDREQAQVGEGVILRLMLTGKGDEQQNHAPTLQLPADVTAYESHQHVDAKADGSWCKTFEYIVQGLKPGVMKIPEQAFTFFDPELYTYRTLHSKPVTLTVHPSKVEQKVEQPSKPKKSKIIPVQKHVDYLPILLWVVTGLLGLLAVLGIFVLVRGRYRATQTPHATAFKRAKKQLKLLQKTHNPSGLYQVLINFFAERAQVPVGHVTELLMRERLIKAGMSTEKTTILLHHVALLTEVAFAKRAVEQQIFVEAERWLDELNRWL